jgi:transcriptional regulator with XRE-family HTH domain
MQPAQLQLIIEGRETARSGRGARVRRFAGISQAELGEAVGVTSTTISRWERGQRQPRGHHAIAYLRALRELNEFWTGGGDALEGS